MSLAFALSLPIKSREEAESTETTTIDPKSDITLPTVISRDRSFLVIEEYKPLTGAFNKKDRQSNTPHTH